MGDSDGKICSKKRRKKNSINRPTIIRRSRRGISSIDDLAKHICKSGRDGPVVFITGAGLSAACGIRTFRSGGGMKRKRKSKKKKRFNEGEDCEIAASKSKNESTALWEEVVWNKATREAFRKNPTSWYNDFWLKYFPGDYSIYKPSHGHEAIAQIASMSDCVDNKNKIDVKVITQNVDGLHSRTCCEWDYKSRLIEAHGKVGLYKCIPEEDSDTDSESDIDDDRPVKLGSRRKALLYEKESTARLDQDKKLSPSTCVYEFSKSLQSSEILPMSAREILMRKKGEIDESSTPLTLEKPLVCPGCKKRNCVIPNALLFDEGYHSHSHYNFQRAEEWIANASALIFVGTSFAVTITNVALDFAREKQVPVYNFNLFDRLEPTCRLQVENIMGPADDTLTSLLERCRLFLNNDFIDDE